MLNFKIKSSILLLTVASISAQAQDYPVEDIPMVEESSALMQNQTAKSNTTNTTTEAAPLILLNTYSGPSCPADFYALPLYPNAKFCQLFAEELPASMSYFALSDQQTAKAFYLEQLGQAEDEKMLNGRIVLQYADGQKVVVISRDGQGSQIDILIKSAG